MISSLPHSFLSVLYASRWSLVVLDFLRYPQVPSLLVISLSACKIFSLLYSARTFQFPVFTMFFRCTSGLFGSRVSSQRCPSCVMISPLNRLCSRLELVLFVVSVIMFFFLKESPQPNFQSGGRKTNFLLNNKIEFNY